MLHSFQGTKNIWEPVLLRKPSMIFFIVTKYSGEAMINGNCPSFKPNLVAVLTRHKGSRTNTTPF